MSSETKNDPGHLPTMPDPSRNNSGQGSDLPTMPDPVHDPERGQQLPTDPDPVVKPSPIKDPSRPEQDSGGDIDDPAEQIA
jgi:hypothetical protein